MAFPQHNPLKKWLCMYGYVCMAMYVWLCMYGYVCMAMYVWLCMYGYVLYVFIHSHDMTLQCAFKPLLPLKRRQILKICFPHHHSHHGVRNSQ